MRNALALAVLIVGVGALLPAAAQSRDETTTPGVIYVLKVSVDDKGIHIPKDQFTKNGITRYPRGAEIRYEFTNKGSKPYAVFMWAADTVVMKAHGGKASMFVNWQYRDTYHYWRILRGHKLRPIGTIIIF
ncbi:MAG TPA: hypothetical protein VGI77_03525 [Gaiellaceae bacterium]|jgi:hypothetical protein